ncbi:MAG: hypothetical protein WAT09_03975 [Paracoccaceae bacterium]
MARLISIAARLMTANPTATARQFALTGLVGAIAALLFITFWAASVSGLVLLLASSIGVTAAVFAVAGIALAMCLGLFFWISASGQARRRERFVRTQQQQSIITAALAALPATRINSAAFIIAGLLALAFLSGKPKRDPR